MTRDQVLAAVGGFGAGWAALALADAVAPPATGSCGWSETIRIAAEAVREGVAQLVLALLIYLVLLRLIPAFLEAVKAARDGSNAQIAELARQVQAGAAATATLATEVRDLKGRGAG